MNNKKNVTLAFFFLAFLSFVTAHSFAFSEGIQYENQKIERIDVIMMNMPEGCPTDSHAITSRIKSKVGELFNQVVFDNDLKILATDYDRVDPFLECNNDNVFITLKIWPKPTIRTILWNGNCKIKTDSLRKELNVASCAVFDRREFNLAFHKLKAYYVKKGFFEAQLSYDIIPAPLSNEVDIQININEGRAGWIKNICFVNFTRQERSALLDMMITKKYNFFTSWLTDEGVYREEAVQQDELIILNYLQNEGYADARVKLDVSECEQQNRIVITITADKGEKYTIGSLTFKGNKLFSDAQIRKRFLIRSGGKYSPEAIRDTITNITDLYGKYGYIDTVVNYEPKLVENEYAYDVDFSIEEGEQFRIGLIKVFGNWCTQTRIILHESLLIPGEVFNIEKLKATEERLANIGFFKNVNVYAVKSEGVYGLGDSYRDVHIEVQEASTGSFGAFFGYSTSESLFGGFNITENNFNDEGFYCLGSRGPCALRGGGQYANFSTTFGTKSRSYVFSWSKPYFRDTPWTIGFDIDRTSNRYVSKEYDFESTGFILRGGYQVNAFVKTGVHYRFKNTHLRLTHHDDEIPKELCEEAKNSGNISAVGWNITYDSTNHPMWPTKGLKSRLELELAGLGGDHSFIGSSYTNSYFFQNPKDLNGVWKIRADLRFIQPYGQSDEDTVPLDERFFFGGDNTIRGYRPYRLGPHYEGKPDDPKGGISMQLLSLEYSRSLFSRLQVFAFIDAGHLSMKNWHFGRMHSSIGYGARLLILPGAPPLVIGMGYPINPRRHGDVKRFFLTLGGRF